MRMPFLVRWPGKIDSGTRYEQLVQNIDYAPTFLDAAGVAVPERVQGESMVPLFEDPNSQNWRKYLYYHYYEHMTEHNVPRHDGVRGERYKLINFYSDDGWNLYDLKMDPNEMMDLSKKPEYRDVLVQMQGQLARLREQYELPGYEESAKH